MPRNVGIGVVPLTLVGRQRRQDQGARGHQRFYRSEWRKMHPAKGGLHWQNTTALREWPTAAGIVPLIAACRRCKRRAAASA